MGGVWWKWLKGLWGLPQEMEGNLIAMCSREERRKEIYEFRQSTWTS